MLSTSSGVEPSTSWSPVSRASNWATYASLENIIKYCAFGKILQNTVYFLDYNGSNISETMEFSLRKHAYTNTLKILPPKERKY